MKKRRFIVLTLLLALIMASAALAEAGGVQLQLVSVQSDGGTVGRCAADEVGHEGVLRLVIDARTAISSTPPVRNSPAWWIVSA